MTAIDDEALAGARQFVEIEPDELPDEQFIDGPYERVPADFLKQPRRRNGANEYERKISVGLKIAAQWLANNETTVPDAAMLYLRGPQLSEAWGNAAAYDKRIGRAIDWLTKPTDDPVSLAIMTTLPVVLQAIRNHEPQLEPHTRGIRIPFRKNPDGTPKRFRFKFGIRLRGIRSMTQEPKAIAEYVFTDPSMVEKLRSQGIHVAGYIRPE